MVAAGGSGSSFNAYGAPGGSIYGLKVKENLKYSYYNCTDTSQTKGYKFGIGCQGLDSTYAPSSGGGGGYYGGVTGRVDSETFNNGCLIVSSSGSSFVSGFDGCIAIKESDDNKIEASNSNIHYSGAYFSKSKILSGDKDIPSPTGITETGHSGDGFVRITFIQNIASENQSNIKIKIILKQMIIVSILHKFTNKYPHIIT